MFALVASLRIRPGAYRDFLAAIADNAQYALRDEPGCLRFDVVQDNSASDHFILYELYADAAAFDAHRGSAHFRRWREAAARCLAEAEGQVNTYGRLVLEASEAARLARACVVRGATARVVERGAGVRTIRLTTRALGAREFLSGITEFAPGAALPMHTHNCEESVVVLEGAGTFECEGSRSTLAPYDATWVPAGAGHRFINSGAGILRILWTYGRTDATRTLVGTDEMFLVDAETHAHG